MCFGINRILDRKDYIILECSSHRDDDTNEALNLFLYQMNPEYLTFDRNHIYVEGKDNMKLVRGLYWMFRPEK